ncbi:MAG: tetratricopeptide repeat protein [Nitrospira sp.]|nr:tetratricopeptide repeat protein [Nitrospira sp.]
MATRKPKNKPRREQETQKLTASGREMASWSGTTSGGHSPLGALLSTHKGAVPDALAMLALCLLVAVSYFPATTAGFIWDDRAFTETKPVQRLSGLLQIWFDPRALKHYEGHYWPVLYTTFWLEHKLWGFATAGYHIVNLLLHSAVTLLLWRLLRRLSVPGAWVAAAVFAVHPVHVEPAVWVIGRKDLLAGLFYLATVLTYIRFVEDGRRGRYIGALVLFGMGLLSKSIVLTLPVSLLIWHWWNQGRVTGANIRQVLPFLALGLGVTVIDWLSYKDLEDVTLDYSSIERVLIAVHTLWFYAGKLVWPTELAVIYPHWDVSADNPLAWGYFVATVGVLVALWVYRHRVGRGPLAGVLFFSVTLSPTLGFVDYGYMQFAFAADRYQYLAGIGIIVTLVSAVAHGVNLLSDAWKPAPGSDQGTGVQAMAITVATAVAVAVMLGVLGVISWQQAGIYQNEGAYFGHITSFNPRARSAYYNFGNWLKDEGRNEDALDAYRHALDASAPDIPAIRTNMGVAFENLKQYDQAEEQYRLALQVKPRYKNAMNNLALLLTRVERYEESLELYRNVIKLDRNYVDAHTGMGFALAWLNRPREALRSLERARAMVPSRRKLGTAREQLASILGEIDQYHNRQKADVHYRRALEYRKQGRLEDALAALRTGQEQSPESTEIPMTMGIIAEEMGRFDEAATHYQRALEINPHVPDVLNRFGALRIQQQRYEEAITLFQTLIAIEPGFAKVYSGMGIALFHLKRYDEALRNFEQALSLDPSLEEAKNNRDHVRQLLGHTSE